MLSIRTSTRRAVARLLVATFACALAASFAATAHASGPPVAQMAIAMPHSSVVSGSIPFAARNLGRGVVKVVFRVDRRRWTARRAPFRYHGGMLNTRRLRNGVHMLMIKATYVNHRSRVAERRVVVDNSARRPDRTKGNQPSASGPLDAGVIDPRAGGIAGPSVALFNRETFQYATSLSTAAESTRYQTIVLQVTDAGMVSQLKAANPHLKVLLYSDVLLTQPADTMGWVNCTAYNADQQAHPDWFLHDQNGNLIQDKSYPGAYLMDVGNAAYQQACVAHATAVAQQDHFDGLYLDDVTANAAVVFPSGQTSSQYPNSAAWQPAMSSMVSYATRQIHAAGLLAVGNIGGAFMTSGLWASWSSQFDGSEEQGWWDPSAPVARRVHEWPLKLAEAAWSEAHGKTVLLGSYDTTQAGNRFGFASMLLVAGGQCSYSVSNANVTTDEAWYSEYTTAQQLGAPAGPYRQLSNGVYERVFANGIVLVNPTTAPKAAFSLGGATFSGSGLTNATSASLGSMSALILLRVG